MGFSVQSHEKENVGTIAVEGEVDMFTSPELREKLVPFFKKQNIKAIVVDLSLVSFMDSSGIATLVEGLQWSTKNSRQFILTGLQTNVKNALSLTKLEKVFTIKKNKNDAYKQLCKS